MHQNDRSLERKMIGLHLQAPIHDHPCNLTKTAVKISFPEIKNEVFVNLLGYKGSDLIYLNRCKGVCMDGDERPLRCKPLAIREKKVKMTVRAFRAGSDARTRVKDLILDDHTACGCECGKELGEYFLLKITITRTNAIRCEYWL